MSWAPADFLAAATFIAGYYGVTWVQWHFARSRRITAIIYLLGAAGGLTVVASARDARVSNVAAGIGFVVAILALQSWLFRRQRQRGQSFFWATRLVYRDRLSILERTVFFALGLGLIVLLALPPNLGWFARVFGGGLALWLLYCAVTGRPPMGTRAPAAEATESPTRGDAERGGPG